MGKEGKPSKGDPPGLEQFPLVDYQFYYDNKLRNRHQGERKSTREYYYDILDLCPVVNKTMSEG